MTFERRILRSVTGCMAAVVGLTDIEQQAPTPQATLVVHGGRLFDGTGGPSIPLGAIVVRDGRIAEILAIGAQLPTAAHVIDAEGCTVLPRT